MCLRYCSYNELIKNTVSESLCECKLIEQLLTCNAQPIFLENAVSVTFFSFLFNLHGLISKQTIDKDSPIENVSLLKDHKTIFLYNTLLFQIIVSKKKLNINF